MPGKLLTTAELAAELGLSDRTLQRYRRDGVLKPKLSTPGGHARWDLEDVLDQLNQIEQTRSKD